MHRNNDWVGRWRHAIYSGCFTLESNPHPFFLAFLPDTWLFSAMETTPIFCVYYALPFHPAPLQSLPYSHGTLSPKCKPGHIWLKFSVVEMLWKYFPNQHLPTSSIHSVPPNTPWPCAPTVPNHPWFAEYAMICPTLMPLSRQLPQPAKSPFSYLALGCHLNCYHCSKDSPGNPGKIYWSPCYASSSVSPSVLSHGWPSYLTTLIADTQLVKVETRACFIFQMTATNSVQVSSP